jgi:hypothetical protein
MSIFKTSDASYQLLSKQMYSFFIKRQTNAPNAQSVIVPPDLSQEGQLKTPLRLYFSGIAF